MKFTFKTDRPTGPYSSFYSSYYHIKFNKEDVGVIVDRTWKIRFMVIKEDINEDGNPNCEWKWITLKKESATLLDAKQWLNDNIEAIFRKYKIHFNETRPQK
jgi:hypothetical protein